MTYAVTFSPCSVNALVTECPWQNLIRRRQEFDENGISKFC